MAIINGLELVQNFKENNNRDKKIIFISVGTRHLYGDLIEEIKKDCKFYDVKIESYSFLTNVDEAEVLGMVRYINGLFGEVGVIFCLPIPLKIDTGKMVRYLKAKQIGMLRLDDIKKWKKYF